MATWRELLQEALVDRGESFKSIVSNTMTEDEMDKEFDDGFGGREGIGFTVWTERRVYFPATYDGAEWVASVSRDPDGGATEHIGGG